VREYLELLLDGHDLGEAGARAAMGLVMRGESTPAQTAALFVALRAKGETVDEIAGCAAALREHVVAVAPRRRDLVDTAGTGGDAAGTFNISTTAALVAAAAGAGVAKHGNRAVSSRSGSADVLEALGVVVELPHQAVADLIDDVGFGFLYAPSHHPAMRHAAPVRRELGIRTVMNLLGPLANPVLPSTQVIGVARSELVETFARVLERLGTERALVVHGTGGVDELTPVGPALMATVGAGGVTLGMMDPLDIGVPRCAPEDLAGGDATENARIVHELFGGARGPRRDAVLLNAAAALMAAGRVADLRDGLATAAAAVDDGRAGETLDRLVRASQGAKVSA
jgi:anthranilate phosphoribosyltransferase